MSLDVYLYQRVTCPKCECRIDTDHRLYSSNITHNLNRMAEAAGIYMHLWRPEEIGIDTAEQLIEPLAEGIRKLLANPKQMRTYNASNGWGMYEHFVPFVQEYLAACTEHPTARVEACR